MSQSHIDFMLSKIPMGRFGAVDEVVVADLLARQRGMLVLHGRGVRRVGRTGDLLRPARESRSTPGMELRAVWLLVRKDKSREMAMRLAAFAALGIGMFWYPAFAAPAQPKRLDIDAVNNADRSTPR